jgi:hypothetical protein
MLLSSSKAIEGVVVIFSIKNKSITDLNVFLNI